MFPAVPLPNIRSFPLYIRHCYMSCRFDDSSQARPGWNSVPSWSCLKAVIKPAWHIAVPNVKWKTSHVGQRNCPKHVEFLDKNKFGKSVRLFVLLKRNLQWYQAYSSELLDKANQEHTQHITRNYLYIKLINVCHVNSFTWTWRS